MSRLQLRCRSNKMPTVMRFQHILIQGAVAESTDKARIICRPIYGLVTTLNKWHLDTIGVLSRPVGIQRKSLGLNALIVS